MLFVDAIDQFGKYQLNIERSPRTIEAYREDLHLLNRYLEEKYNGLMYLDDIKKTDIEEYLLFLKEEKKYKDDSRKRLLASYRSFFKYAHRHEWCEKNVTELLEPIKVRQKERHFLNDEEVNTFIEAIDHRLIKLVAQTLYYTGMRITECLNLQLDDIEIEKGIIRVNQGKGNKDRTIPINPRLKELFIDYIENWRVPSPNFFATQISGSLSRNSVGLVFRETSKKLGLKKTISAHTLRHSFASQLVSKDVHLVKISKLLGHNSLKTTSIYVHSSMDDLKEAINTL